MWGEGSHDGVHKGKLWIFFARNSFFFDFFWTPVLQAWYSQIWPNLGQIWVNFDQKGPFLKFPQKSENAIFFRLQRLCFEQKIRKIWCVVLEKNAKNLHFLSLWAKKTHFGLFLAKMAKTVKIIKKALGTFFLTFWTLTSYKISEKSNERFPRKSVPYGRTDGRTRLLRSQTTVGRETKNFKISNV